MLLVDRIIRLKYSYSLKVIPIAVMVFFFILVSGTPCLSGKEIEEEYNLGQISLTISGDLSDPNISGNLDFVFMFTDAIASKIGSDTEIEYKVKGEKKKRKVRLWHDVLGGTEFEKEIRIKVDELSFEGTQYKTPQGRTIIRATLKFFVEFDILPLKKSYKEKVMFGPAKWTPIYIVTSEVEGSVASQMERLVKEGSKKVQKDFKKFLKDYMEEIGKDPSRIETYLSTTDSIGVDTRQFLFENFSTVGEGDVPEGWICGETMMVKKDENGEYYLTEYQSSNEHTLKILDLGCPDDFKLTIDFLWDWGAVFFYLGDLEIRLRDTGEVHVANTDTQLGRRLENKRHILTIFKERSVFKIFLDNQKIHMGRYPQYQEAASLTFKTDPRFWPAKHFAIYEIAGESLGL